MRKNISIISVEEKKTRTDTPQVYWSYKTDQGQMSCFDGATAAELSNNIGKSCELELQVSGNYTNIIGFIKVIGEAEKPAKDSGPADGARLRRITDCILAANQNYLSGKLSHQDIILDAKALYKMIGVIDADQLQDK